MRPQKLRTSRDFLRRIEIIPEVLLIVTADDSIGEDWSIAGLQSSFVDIPFYQLDLVENAELVNGLATLGIVEKNYEWPVIFYFRDQRIVEQIAGIKKDKAAYAALLLTIE